VGVPVSPVAPYLPLFQSDSIWRFPPRAEALGWYPLPPRGKIPGQCWRTWSFRSRNRSPGL